VLVALSKAVNGTSTLFLNLYAVHFLAPAEFGALTLATTCLFLLDGMLGAAIDLAVVKLSADADLTARSATSAERAAITIKLIACTLAGLIVVAAAGPLGEILLHRSRVRPLFVAWSVAATAILVLRSTQIGLQLRRRFTAYAAIELTNTTVRISLAVVALRAGYGSSLAIVICYALSALVALGIGFSMLIKASSVRSWLGLGGARDLLKACQTPLLTYSFSSLVSRLDVIILSIAGTPAQLGIFGSALAVATVPEIAATYLAPAFLPRIGPYCRQGIFLSFFKRFHLALMAVLVPGFVLAAFLVMKAGPYILPPKYSYALPLIMALLPGTVATASLFPISLNFLMLRNSKIFLWNDLVSFPFLIIAYWMAASKGLLSVALVTTAFRLVKTVIVQNKALQLARQARLEGEETQTLSVAAL